MIVILLNNSKKYTVTKENQRTAARIMVKAARITGQEVPEHVKAFAEE